MDLASRRRVKSSDNFAHGRSVRLNHLGLHVAITFDRHATVFDARWKKPTTYFNGELRPDGAEVKEFAEQLSETCGVASIC